MSNAYFCMQMKVNTTSFEITINHFVSLRALLDWKLNWDIKFSKHHSVQSSIQIASG